MSFKDLGLHKDLLQAVLEKGYQETTPIQTQAIPIILAGKDTMAAAQTGTGKTASFTLPLLHRLLEKSSKPVKNRIVRALILVPTRELAAQVQENVRIYSKYTSLKSTAIFGGVSIGSQIKNLRIGVDVVIATPGRLLDHVRQKTINLSHVEILVLDEADHMLDMGFIQDIRKIIELLPENKQNLLFSATFSKEIKNLAASFLQNPQIIDTTPPSPPKDLVTQVVHPVDNNRKKELLSFLIQSHNWKQVLVFTRTKQGANKLAQQLSHEGIVSEAIHSNKTQAARTKALKDFKAGFLQVLVATDIASRGLDIDQLPCVINFEIPHAPSDYVHRIGRTGRAGKEGSAYSLVCVDEQKHLKDIERVLKKKIDTIVIPGFEPDPSIQPEATEFRRPFNRFKRTNNKPRFRTRSKFS